MLTIKILGTGCPRCKRLEAITREAVTQVGVDAEFIKVTDMATILSYELLATPGLVINEKLLSSGRLPTSQELVEWIRAFSAVGTTLP